MYNLPKDWVALVPQRTTKSHFCNSNPGIFLFGDFSFDSNFEKWLFRERERIHKIFSSLRSRPSSSHICTDHLAHIASHIPDFNITPATKNLFPTRNIQWIFKYHTLIQSIFRRTDQFLTHIAECLQFSEGWTNSSQPRHHTYVFGEGALRRTPWINDPHYQPKNSETLNGTLLNLSYVNWVRCLNLAFVRKRETSKA